MKGGWVERLAMVAACAAALGACAREDDTPAIDLAEAAKWAEQDWNEEGWNKEDWDDDDADADDEEEGAARPARASAPTFAAIAGGGATAAPAPQRQPAPSSQAGRRGLPKGAVRLEPTVIVDASGFEKPMGAATLFTPEGWRAQGGVLWGREYLCTNGYAFNWMAVSPDGMQAIAVLPQERWETNNYGAAPSTPGCQSAPYTNVQQYLQGLAQRWRPGARAIDYRPRPDIARDFAQLNQTTPTAMGEIRTWVEAGELLFAYADRGVEMRGVVSAAAVFTLMRSHNGMGGSMDALTGATFPVWAASAPNGRLNLGFLEAIRRSIKTNPQWERRISGHNVAIAQVAIEESRKRADMIARSNAEISRIRQEAWSAYQESADRRAREFGELIRGVETYTDGYAPGGSVELSRNYDHAWRMNDGSYILTNDASFDPWKDLQLEGRKLEPTP